MKKYKLKRLVSYLCDVMGISRSGYYNYFSEKSAQKRVAQEQADEVVKEIILKAYHFRGRKKGARQIKMTLENQYGITYNLKRIRRVMKKYQIICPIRKANPTRRMAKATIWRTTNYNLPRISARNRRLNLYWYDEYWEHHCITRYTRCEALWKST
ncbi:IS3 family transposase [Lysinibacillus xylanilyticus]|uniref:IS3 family transposase n=1 Tax=Lysinibacillus xylanilyticus TaxID=582475 RepID=UPI0038008C37